MIHALETWEIHNSISSMPCVALRSIKSTQARENRRCPRLSLFSVFCSSHLAACCAHVAQIERICAWAVPESFLALNRGLKLSSRRWSIITFLISDGIHKLAHFLFVLAHYGLAQYWDAVFFGFCFIGSLLCNYMQLFCIQKLAMIFSFHPKKSFLNLEQNCWSYE